MEEIIILTGASLIALYFAYRINNLFKGHCPELEGDEDLKSKESQLV